MASRRIADESHAAGAGESRTEVETSADLVRLVGTRLGTSPWVAVTQADIDDFARITRDEQWIHVDHGRAAGGPFGTPIAHGFFVLSLCAYFVDSVLEVLDAGMTINYGLDRVRFPSPVPIGSRLRGHVHVESASEIQSGIHLKLRAVVEVEGHEKPACVAALVSRIYENPDASPL